MVTRCISSVDSINNVSSFIYDKHQKRNVYGIAEGNLRRIARERNEDNNRATNQHNKILRRNTSAPANLFQRREKLEREGYASPSRDTACRSGTESFSFAATSSTGRSTTALRYAGQTGIKKRRMHSTGTRGCSEGPKMRTKSVEQKGKTQMNRYVKEILNKIECGHFASEWQNFNGAASPSPKWMDFYSGENGGALDAFLCKGPENEGSSCYLIDVGVGERVARLMKYPQQIRVGQNGVVSELDDNKKQDLKKSEDEITKKNRKIKERTLPLSWSEQLQWKDAKIVTTSDDSNNSEKVTQDAQCTYQIKTYSEPNQRRERQFKAAGLPSKASYLLTSSNLKIQQKLPWNSSRDKFLKDYSFDLDRKEKQTISDRRRGMSKKENASYAVHKKYHRKTDREVANISANESRFDFPQRKSIQYKDEQKRQSATARDIEGTPRLKNADVLKANNDVHQKSQSNNTNELNDIGIHEVSLRSNDNNGEKVNLLKQKGNMNNSTCQETIDDELSEKSEVISKDRKNSNHILKKGSDTISNMSLMKNSKQSNVAKKFKKRVSFEGFGSPILKTREEEQLQGELPFKPGHYSTNQEDNTLDADQIESTNSKYDKRDSSALLESSKEQLAKLRTNIQESIKMETLQLEKDLALLKVDA